MAKKKAVHPLVELAESTALLFLLDRVPEGARLNTAPTRNSGHDHHSLSFNQELDICQALAFIAGISDGPAHVLAVAVQGTQSQDRIHVKLAINKSEPHSSEKTLKQAVEGLRSILYLLTRVAKGDTEVTTAKIFIQVIEVCRLRILKRMRSRKVKVKHDQAARCSFISLLKSFLAAIRSRNQPSVNHTLIERIESLVRTMEEIESIESVPQEQVLLQDLVRKAGRVLRHRRFDNIIRELRSKKARIIDPSIVESVNEKLGKIANYSTASRCLYKYAQTLKAFRQFSIDSVGLPPEHLPANTVKTTLSSVLQGLGVDKSDRKRLILKMKLDRKSNPAFDPEREFQKTVRDTLSSGKVHAEVQLLFHCEGLKPTQRPRVIMSTKSACFMCNAIFRLHERYYTPATHGRLYPGWLLPGDHNQLANNLAIRLNKLAQEHNRRIITEMLSPSPRTRFPEGNESLVHPFSVSRASSTSSLILQTVASVVHSTRDLSLARSIRSLVREEPPMCIRRDTPSNPSQLEVGNIVPNQVHREQSIRQHDLTSAENLPASILTLVNEDHSCNLEDLDPQGLERTVAQAAPSSISPEADRNSTRSAAESTSETSRELRVNETHHYPLRPGDTPLHIRNKFINLYLEYPKRDVESGHRQSEIVAELEWFSMPSFSSTAPGIQLHDIRGLSDMTEVHCGENGQIYLAIGSHIIRIGRKPAVLTIAQ